MELYDLAKDYLILKKIQSSIEKKLEENAKQIKDQPEAQEHLKENREQLDKRLESNQARLDKAWGEIKGKAKELVVDQGRGAVELLQQGAVIVALAGGAPNSEQLLKDLLNTPSKEIEYAAELQAERQRKENKDSGKRSQDGEKDKPKDPEHDATKQAKEKLLTKKVSETEKASNSDKEVDYKASIERAKQELLDKQISEETKKQAETRRQQELQQDRTR